MEPNKDTIIQKLLQENATLTLVKAQLESMVEQYEQEKQAKAEDK